MEKQFISIIVFGLLSIFAALFFHKKFRNILISSIISALLASLLFQVIEFFVLGNLDPFFFIAFVNSLIISFIISILVGVPFVYRRKRAKTNN
jgi:fructose-specific phosphotransferase system IIC component